MATAWRRRSLMPQSRHTGFTTMTPPSAPERKAADVLVLVSVSVPERKGALRRDSGIEGPRSLVSLMPVVIVDDWTVVL